MRSAHTQKDQQTAYRSFFVSCNLSSNHVIKIYSHIFFELDGFFFFDKDIKVNDYLDYDSIKQYTKHN